MKPTFRLSLLLLALGTPVLSQTAPVIPTKMNFQGRIAKPDGTPVADAANVTLNFRLFSAVSGGTALWSQTITNAVVRNGVTAVSLDFSSGYASGQIRLTTFAASPYLEIQVGTDPPLAPRMPFASTAYAFYADAAASAYSVPSGAITLANLAPGVLSFGSLTGSLLLSQIPDSLITGAKLAPGALNNVAWGVTGNFGTDPLANFVGTTDNVPFSLRTNNSRGFRLEFAQSSTITSINVIGGHSGNAADSSVIGATIAGGGGVINGAAASNRVQNHYGSIGGGASNTTSGTYATIAGGTGNMASGISSSIGGGASNTASGISATIPGGSNNSAAGNYSFAAGRSASAANNGTFVWADGTSTSFTSVSDNTFLIRAGSGVGINKNNPTSGSALDVSGIGLFSGKLGIGTTSPSTTLDVNGTSTLRGNTTITSAGTLTANGNTQLSGKVSVGSVAPDPAAPLLVQSASNNLVILANDTGSYRWRLNLSDDGAASGLAFVESGTGGLSRLYLKPGGNVGIGNTSPQRVLDVTGNAAISSDVYVGGVLQVNGTVSSNAGGIFPSLTAATVTANSLTTVAGAQFGGNVVVQGTSRTYGGAAFGAVAPPDSVTPVVVQAGVNDDLMVFTNPSGLNYRWRFRMIPDSSSDAFGFFESGVTSPRIYVKPGGNVGIGNTAPTEKLHVTGTTRFDGGTVLGNAATPDPVTPLVIQAGSNDDLMVFTNTAGTNYRWRLRMMTDGSSDGFSLYESGAATRIYVKPGGNVGIGTTSPTEKLTVAGNVLANNVAVPSDRRFKHDIATLPNALDTVLNLRGVTYEYDRAAWPRMNFNPGRQVGFIAQEVEAVLPELVRTDANGYKSVSYANMTPVIVEALKSLKAEKDAEIETLKAKNAELEAKLNALMEAVKGLQLDRK